MKKLSLLILMITFCGFGAMAQNTAATPEQRATMMTEKMNKQANFTAEQKAQVQNINLEAAQKLQVVRQEAQAGTISPATAKERRQTINQERENKIVAILTPEQRTKYNRMQSKRSANSSNANLPNTLKSK
jgi:Spy/CpxP family protein refolding chaperone